MLLNVLLFLGTRQRRLALLVHHVHLAGVGAVPFRVLVHPDFSVVLLHKQATDGKESRDGVDHPANESYLIIIARMLVRIRILANIYHTLVHSNIIFIIGNRHTEADDGERGRQEKHVPLLVVEVVVVPLQLLHPGL